MPFGGDIGQAEAEKDDRLVGGEAQTGSPAATFGLHLPSVCRRMRICTLVRWSVHLIILIWVSEMLGQVSIGQAAVSCFQRSISGK